MASQQLTKQLAEVTKTFKSLNFDAALKKNLGDQSLNSTFSARISEVQKQLDRAASVAERVNDGSVRALGTAISAANQQIGQLTGTDPAAFIQNRNQYQTAIANVLDGIESALLPFRVLLQEETLRGLLEPDQVALKSTQDFLKVATDTILADVKREAESVLADAKKQATTIHSTARAQRPAYL